eukprot:UN02374
MFECVSVAATNIYLIIQHYISITTLYCYNRYSFIVTTLHIPFCIITRIILGYFVMYIIKFIVCQ